MDITLILYCINLLNNFDEFIALVFIIYFMFYVIGLAIYSGSDGENTLLIKILNKNAWIIILLVITSCFIPSKETMYLMLGTSYLKDSDLPKKVSQAIELKLDSVIKDLKESK